MIEAADTPEALSAETMPRRVSSLVLPIAHAAQNTFSATEGKNYTKVISLQAHLDQSLPHKSLLRESLAEFGRVGALSFAANFVGDKNRREQIMAVG